MSVPEKANRVLNVILIAFVLIAIRVGHIALYQHEEKKEASHRPRRRTVIEKAERAPIADRHGTLLAQNKVQYTVSIAYCAIREVPRTVWRRSPEGRKVKVERRKEYISELSNLLGQELEEDPARLEDLIHSKASLFGSLPFPLKENISERQYFRLKMLERQWPGIVAEVKAVRSYPLSKVGGSLVGYLGAINQREYQSITEEMKELRERLNWAEEGELFVDIEALNKRLLALEAKAYSMSDWVGKSGAEAAFEEQLRGKCGKTTYLVNTRGEVVHALEGARAPEPGPKLYLTLSAPLQAYAEQLLTEFEQAPVSERPAALQRRALLPEKQPWMKGGAILALDPNTGQILAMASYPRFDPNDFIRSGNALENGLKNERIHRWLESEAYLAAIWEERRPLERERFNLKGGSFYEETIFLSWENYLDLILPKKAALREVLKRADRVEEALSVQTRVERLLTLFTSEEPISASILFDHLWNEEEATPTGVIATLEQKEWIEKRLEECSTEISSLKKALHPLFHFLPLNQDKLLFVDLMRLAVDSRRFGDSLLSKIQSESLGDYKAASASYAALERACRKVVEKTFERTDFATWRREQFKGFLAAKRKEEEAKRRSARPYLEYLHLAQEELFSHFWEEQRIALLTAFLSKRSCAQLEPYLSDLRAWQESQEEPLALFHCRRLSLLADHLGEAFHDYVLTLRSYRELDRPLLGRYGHLPHCREAPCEKHLAMSFYPAYGYSYIRSFAYAQAARIGSIFKLVPAYEAMRQRFELGYENLNPLVIIDDKHKVSDKPGGWSVGFTEDHRSIPLFYHGGRLPRSEHAGVGRVDIVSALAASSNPYFALLAGEELEDPEDLRRAALAFGFGRRSGLDLPGEIAGMLPGDLAYNRTGLYSFAIGQHTLLGTPLQGALLLATLANGGKLLKPQILLKEVEKGEERFFPPVVREEVPLPDPLRALLLRGMHEVITGTRGTARFLQNQFSTETLRHIVGKSSTAESIEKMGLDGTTGKLMLKHIWFGAIAFTPETPQTFKHPELVVIVYGRLGEFGREGAPLAIKMIEKWRRLKTQEPE